MLILSPAWSGRARAPAPTCMFDDASNCGQPISGWAAHVKMRRGPCWDTQTTLQEPIKDPARFPWHEVTKVAHYWLEVDAMTGPMRVGEDSSAYGDFRP